MPQEACLPAFLPPVFIWFACVLVSPVLSCRAGMLLDWARYDDNIRFVKTELLPLLNAERSQMADKYGGDWQVN